MIPLSRIREYERIGLRAVPAAEEIPVGGWLLRAHGGPWRRANSVQTFEEPGDDPAALCARCDALYGERGQRAIYKMTPASRPADLDARLEELGYAFEAPTRVMTSPLEELDPPAESARSAGPAETSVELRESLEDEWLAAFLGWELRLVPLADRLRALLEGIVPPARFALARAAGRPVGAGLAVLDGEHLGLFDLITEPAARSRGHGTRLLDRLIGWGRAAGAREAWLQVMDDNPRAHLLYERLGFRDAYPYWYRVSSGDPSD
jgi:ribosomal protein S18 acetylase RimI-like enzyme